MAAVLQPNRFTPYRSPPPGGGILLNSPGRSTVALPAPSYRRTSPSSRPSPNSFSSSASSSDDGDPSSSTTTTPPQSLHNSLTLDHPPACPGCPSCRRSIRFAPLPDPRRAVIVTEDGLEVPLPAVVDDPADIPSLPAALSCHKLDSLLLGQPVDLDPRALPTITTTPSSPGLPYSASSPPSPASTKRALSPSSTHRVRAATAPNPSSSSSSGLTKKLLKPFMFKPTFSASSTDVSAPGSAASSRESSRTRDDTPAAPPSTWGIPLGRWTSESSSGTVTAAPARRPSAPSASTKSGPSAWGWGAPLGRAQSASSAAPQPKRMLNGRVYGAPRRPPPTGFENVPDKEPEFVEWGFGGMGSVKHAGAGGGAWAKVQSASSAVAGRGRSMERAGAGAGGGGEEDDGSGMAWLRKRREAREKKEAEERARAQDEDARTPTQPAGTNPGSPNPNANLAPVRVALPAPAPHHRAHAPSVSRQNSGAAAEAAAVVEPARATESASASASDADDEEDEDTEGDGEEEEEDEQVRFALCARASGRGDADGLVFDLLGGAAVGGAAQDGARGGRRARQPAPRVSCPPRCALFRASRPVCCSYFAIPRPHTPRTKILVESACSYCTHGVLLGTSLAVCHPDVVQVLTEGAQIIRVVFVFICHLRRRRRVSFVLSISFCVHHSPLPVRVYHHRLISSHPTTPPDPSCRLRIRHRHRHPCH
ncbi:hypothetical protein FA95DRAFT_172802 [Auriscalpium vulgare]|uniref:Uncharacterized protein n=1 Tax=Auriscalpium vulgare TaxID=40419 RepID=A0ACB8RN27_9AGAM|nr:hypothetical protein FA95DRAFT_172802 [Auriscalpium vulgare]